MKNLRQERAEMNRNLRPSEQICIECGQRGVEIIDDYVSNQCCYCNDRDAERYRERQEWDYYHK